MLLQRCVRQVRCVTLTGSLPASMLCSMDFALTLAPTPAFRVAGLLETPRCHPAASLLTPRAGVPMGPLHPSYKIHLFVLKQHSPQPHTGFPVGTALPQAGMSFQSHNRNSFFFFYSLFPLNRS